MTMISRTILRPQHYQGTTGHFDDELRAIGFTDEDLQRDLLDVLRQPKHGHIRRNAYLFTAIKYLWRAGAKDGGDISADVLKARNYLSLLDEPGSAGREAAERLRSAGRLKPVNRPASEAVACHQ